MVSGFDAIERIHREYPSSRILVLSNFQGGEDVHRAMRAGARGYLTKDVDGRQLADALQVVASGGRYLPKFLESRLAECLPGTGITPRERAVLELLAKGFSTAEIARQGNIAEKTVRITSAMYLKNWAPAIEPKPWSSRSNAALSIWILKRPDVQF